MHKNCTNPKLEETDEKRLNLLKKLNVSDILGNVQKGWKDMNTENVKLTRLKRSMENKILAKIVTEKRHMLETEMYKKRSLNKFVN